MHQFAVVVTVVVVMVPVDIVVVVVWWWLKKTTSDSVHWRAARLDILAQRRTGPARPTHQTSRSCSKGRAMLKRLS